MEEVKQKAHKILRWSEKYTKTDMIYLGKGMSFLTIGQGISSASSFVLSLAFANLVPANTYGIYKFLMSVSGILNIATLKGATTALTKSVAQKFEGTLNEITKARLRWSALSIIGGFVVSAWYFYNGNNTLGYAFIIVGLLSPIVDALTTTGPFLQGKKFFGVMTSQYLAFRLIYFTCLLITILLTDNLYYILLGYFLPQVLFKIFIYHFVEKKYKENNDIDPRSLSYAKKLSAINIIPLIASQIDKVLIFHYLGAVEVAAYSFAVAIPEQIFSFFSSIGILALPKYSAQNLNEVRKAVIKKNLLLIPVIILIIVSYIIVSPYVYKIFFPQYIESIFASQIYIFSIIGILGFLPITAISSQEDVGSMAKLRTISSISQLVLVFVFIVKFGIMGAIISRVLSKILGVVTSYYLFLKEDTNIESRVS
jgi:O-antigen/teichoic acid export membrane protein